MDGASELVDASRVSEEKTFPVTRVFLGVTIAALTGLAAWAHFVVHPWAQGAREPDSKSGNYTAPGAFGDSFAPVIGLFAALALGATVASAYMQREELRDSRRNNATQIRLTRIGQRIECWKQIAEIDRIALDEVSSTLERARLQLLSEQGIPEREGPPAVDSERTWLEYWKTPDKERARQFPEIHSADLATYATNRYQLSLVEADLQTTIEGDRNARPH